MNDGAAGDRDRGIGRRAFGVLVAGTTGGIAGCLGQELDPDVDEDDLDGRAATVPRVGSLGQLQFNRHVAAQGGTDRLPHLDQLVLPRDVATGERLSSGHEWTVGDETIEVPTAIRDYEIEPPAGARLEFDDRLTYWNGDPLNARAYYLDDTVRWHVDRGAFDDDRRDDDLESEAVYWRGFGDSEPQNRQVAEALVHPGPPPLPPSFTEPWVERFEDAGSASAASDVEGDLESWDVPLREFVEEGYGSGVYEARSVDDLREETLLTHRREDHPGDAAVEHLIVLAVDADFVDGAVGDGSFDLAPGTVGEDLGDYQPGSLNDDLEEVARFPNPTGRGYRRTGDDELGPGYGLAFDWSNDHLRRLWVRRGLVAALPFDEIVDAGWGLGQRPTRTHAGLLPSVEERILGSEFVDRLYDYPIESDVALAEEWFAEAGYEWVPGQLVSPDGEGLSPTILVPQEVFELADAGAILEAAFDELGIAASLTPATTREYEERVADGDWDLLFSRTTTGWSAVDHFAADASVEGSHASAPSIAAYGGDFEGCEPGDDEAPASVPGEVSLPAEPGALRIDGVDYDDGGATYRFDAGEDRSICSAASRLNADVDDEGYREAARICARWYNYAIPSFTFVRPNVGLIANTAEFSVPPADHRSHRGIDESSSEGIHYHLQAGLFR